ncbi:MAG: HlyD family type I secretion periplasmic adaptor subunit [Shimia sp.]
MRTALSDDAYLRDTRRRSAWPMLLAVVAVLGAVLAWAWLARIDEVVRAPGRVVPAAQIQVVQSLEGGIVAAIAVREGQAVAAGDLLVEIDDTGAGARAGELRARAAALEVEAARLRAEAEGGAFDLPEGRADALPEVVARARAVLRERRAQLAREVGVLETRLAQREGAAAEAEARASGLRARLVPLRAELDLTERLAGRGAVSEIELLRLRARVAELEGDLALTEAGAPRRAAEIGEVGREIAAARAAAALRAREERDRVETELAVLREALRGADDRVARTALRAPMDGIVNRVAVQTLGGVVAPGAPVVEIVPAADGVVIEAELAPRDVASVAVGDAARVKLSAYDFLLHGTLPATVVRIGADTVPDAAGRPVFPITLRADRDHLGEGAGRLPVGVGMEGQVDILAGRRSVLALVAQPILRARAEALR